jgi:hypothetical protein
MTDDQLIDQAANIGLRFAESCGSGHAEVTIHDFRTHDMPV